MENKYIKLLKGQNLDFEKEIDQEDIDRLLEVISDRFKIGLSDLSKEECSYKFIIALAYEMLTDIDPDPMNEYFKKITTQEEKDIFIELYKKYEL